MRCGFFLLLGLSPKTQISSHKAGEDTFFDKLFPSVFTGGVIVQLPRGHVQQAYCVNSILRQQIEKKIA